MIEVIFWLSVSLIIYTYFGYPVMLLILSIFLLKPVKKREIISLVTLIISAYNEEKIIEAKIKNCLELDYPKDKLEILIGSDGSSDKTVEIVERYSGQGVKLYKFNKRGGKVNVLNKLIPKSKGEIILFSDTNTMYEPSAIKELTKDFADPKVGCVCGQLRLRKPIGSIGGELEGIYWKYECFLKKIEGKRGSLLGANGGIYAIRKNLFEPLPADVIVEDFVIPMKILEKRYKVIYEPKAIGYEETAKSIMKEMVRKIRIGAGDFQALFLTRALLNPQYGFVSFAYLSHKVIRWCIPFLLIIVLISNLFLIGERFYFFLFIFQVGFYLNALLGYFLNKSRFHIRLFSLGYYFLSMNLALLLGFFKFLTKTQSVTWERTER